MSKTLFDKIWDAHVVKSIDDSTQVIYIDKHLVHEVTSPQAFTSLEEKGLKVFRPQQTFATVDHNIPTENQHLPIEDELSRIQVESLEKNCNAHNIELFSIGHKNQGIVHVIGPELGITQPGITMVCGDSHTSTHGAFGCIAFGIGTSQVAQVLASQSVIISKPKPMKIEVNGTLGNKVTAKDMVLYIISKVGMNGAVGHFVEFCGEAIERLSMEERMTVCNMSIEMGARGGMIAADETTFEYLKGKEYSPAGIDWEKKIAHWKTLKSDQGATFNKEIVLNAEDIEPIFTYGTTPDSGIPISASIPEADSLTQKSLKYMGFNGKEKLEGKKVDYVFIGSCTNSRIEDLRSAAEIIKGKKKADHVTVWIVPGSQKVLEQAKAEGLDTIFYDAGIKLREPGCSACLAMNADKVPPGALCISTSNRNFEGRQGEGSRTILASPLSAAASAITGVITDPRKF